MNWRLLSNRGVILVLRPAPVCKPMVGCWILAGPQGALTVEQAARRLRHAHKRHILKAGVGLTGPSKLIEESPEQAKARDAIDETLMRE